MARSLLLLLPILFLTGSAAGCCDKTSSNRASNGADGVQKLTVVVLDDRGQSVPNTTFWVLASVPQKYGFGLTKGGVTNGGVAVMDVVDRCYPVEIELSAKASDWYGVKTIKTTPGDDEKEVELEVKRLMYVNVTARAVDQDGNDLGPLERVWFHSKLKADGDVFTDEKGKASIRVTSDSEGGIGEVEARDVKGHVLLSGGTYTYKKEDKVAFVDFKFVRVCDPAWNGHVIDTIRYTSDAGPTDFRLQVNQVKKWSFWGCTQTHDRYRHCNTDISNVTRINDGADGNPLQDEGQLISTFSGYLRVSARDGDDYRMGCPSMDSKAEFLDADGKTLFTVKKAPLELDAFGDRGRTWEIGCIDGDTNKFYCVNGIDKLIYCPSIISAGRVAK